MRFGLALPHYGFSFPDGEPVSFERTAAWAVRAEELGFDSIWVSDHFVYSLARYGASEGLVGALEPITTLAGLAPITSRVRLGTLVLGAPFRHPAMLVKSATALDLLSGGRLEVGIGAGWYEEEFARFGYGFGTVGERFARLEETAEALNALLPGGPVTLANGSVGFREAMNHPEPAQRPRPPIWIGAKGGDRSLRIAARHADGWNTVWRWTPEAYRARVARARELCERAGRDPASFRLSIGLYAVVGEDEPDAERRYEAMRRRLPGAATESFAAYAADTLSGSVDRVVERVASLAEAGAEEVIVSAATLPFAVWDPSMVELIAGAVLPAARAL